MSASPVVTLLQTNAAATGQPVDLLSDTGTVRKSHALQVSVTGTLTALAAAVEGSLDGTSWYPLAVDVTAVAGALQVTPTAPVRFVRGVVRSMTGAGTVTLLYVAA